MADGIKIGSLDISAFKVGYSDCKVYLGSTLLYPQSQPQTLQWVEYVSGDTIPSDLDIYGISGTAYNLQSAFGLGDPIYMDLSRNKVTINVDHSCYYEEDIPKDDIVRIIFSDYTCSDYYNQAATVRFPIQLYINSSPTPPTPTSYTYSVIITGLENGDTTTIWWCDENWSCFKTDSNVGNGIYTVSTATDVIKVQLDTSGLSDYTVDHDHLELYSGGSQTVTFTYQGGGGGGLVQIPYGTDMSQYYGQYVKRLVINDTSVSGSGAIFQNWWNDYISLSPWQISGGGQFSSINSLPIDITLSGQGAQLNYWGYDGTTLNHLNDLQIEWA